MTFSHASGARAVIILQNATLNTVGSEQPIPEDAEESSRNSRTSKYFFSSDMTRVLASGYTPTSSSIFAPFPSQVLPLLVFWAQLGLAGFELIADETVGHEPGVAISSLAYE
jgi:hypothetical protein